MRTKMRKRTLTLVVASMFAAMLPLAMLTSTISAADQDSNNAFAKHKQKVLEFLGMSEEEMKQAREDGKRIPELVEEQGKTMRDFKDAVGPRPGSRGKKHSKHKRARPEMRKQLAEFLGISEDELKQAKQDGKTIEDLLEENEKTQEELHSYMQEKAKERIAKLVEEGKLTQEEADEKLEWIESRKPGEHSPKANGWKMDRKGKRPIDDGFGKK